jgi:hypothetical protein
MARIVVHVTPKSGRDEIVGWRGGELWVKVTAAPEGGKANASVERLLASALGVPKSRAHVVRGHTARVKSVEIDDLEDRAIGEAFGEPDPRLF